MFIDNSKTATIVGYLFSIFSSLVGQAISTVIYPFPSEMPASLLLFPPWALARGIYLIGFACANNSSCYRHVYDLAPEMYRVYWSLSAWIFVFVGAVYFDGVVQQEYGTRRVPEWMQWIGIGRS